MTFLESLLIALALAMDCFTVSITCGIMQRKMGMQVWGMAFMFGFFQAIMAFLGWIAVGFLTAKIEQYDHWISFSLLSLLGCKMIWDGVSKKECPSFEPSNALVLLMLSIATSVDALAVGCSFEGMGLKSYVDVMYLILSIGCVSFLMSVIGKYIGVNIVRDNDWPTEQIGGIVLIFIGFKVLIQHLSAI